MRRGVKAPLGWFGGKHQLATRIVAEFGPHHTYVEPFGGAASVLLCKPPSPVEVYNDLDGNLVNFFRVLRDPGQGLELRRRLALTPYSRAEWRGCRDGVEAATEPIERARRWYVAMNQGRGTSDLAAAGWLFSVGASRTGRAGAVNRWQGNVAGLEAVAARLLRVQIEAADWRSVLSTYDTDATLCYLDPPYVHATRLGHRYAYELTDDDHRELVSRCLGMRGGCVVSGYDHPIYAPLAEAGWRTLSFDVPSRLADDHVSERNRRREMLWVKPRTRGQASLFAEAAG